MPILRGDDPAAVAAAARCLADGGLVGMPTETVYGLAARADDDRAAAGIFAAKGRPADHPLIVHVTDVAAARSFAAHWHDTAQRLAAAFWPGPVTLIVPRAAGRGSAAAGGHPTIGLRCPAHPVAQALLHAAAALGVAGVAAPSANRFGRVSPTLASHVADEFGPALLVLDGGPCAVGIESSIVDCSRDEPVLLRPGLLTRERLEAALGRPLRERDADAPRSSGDLASHYAPAARVRLIAADALYRADMFGAGVAVYSRSRPAGADAALWRALPDDPARAAQDLFAVLRAFDGAGAREIWVEEPPDLPEWEGVRDRLRRAAA
ncbi:threonylcarbamoyl-AMP synthase [Aquincola sp. S2]|uniref:Threonylcarbamoyl-AMP synthase n=1 Tax=Pseudaquabacterium terrae TaxID=2732868 RepID=A0ABX2EC21_9BURK|nr:L-threonylcarbamoyladenylate synthase [Aquabacterium terrae]NRF66699.1 threonylcarbamoyl-AMP synthase [Aquabacterium terrae]